MLTEPARVLRRDGRRVELELQRASACGHCELSEGCGTGALGRLLGHRARTLTIETERRCEPGDDVLLCLPETALVATSLLLYGMPLLGLLAGAALTIALQFSEPLVVAGALLGLLAGFRVAAYCARRLEQRGFAPYIREIRSENRGELPVNPGLADRS